MIDILGEITKRHRVGIRQTEDRIVISFPYRSNSFDKSKVLSIAEEVEKMRGKVTREGLQYGERLTIKIPVSSKTIEYLPSGEKEEVSAYTQITAITLFGWDSDGKRVDGASLHVEPHYIGNENVGKAIQMIATLYEVESPKNL